ncbi:MAG: hypothetical protein ACPG4K_06270 [Haloferula sp.]
MNRWILMSLSVLVLSSCNTYIGLGRDIRKLGEGMGKVGEGMEETAYGRKSITGTPQDQQEDNLPTY